MAHEQQLKIACCVVLCVSLQWQRPEMQVVGRQAAPVVPEPDSIVIAKVRYELCVKGASGKKQKQ